MGLTDEEHDELGGVEYRALKVLLWVLFCTKIFPVRGLMVSVFLWVYVSVVVVSRTVDCEGLVLWGYR